MESESPVVAAGATISVARSRQLACKVATLYTHTDGWMHDVVATPADVPQLRKFKRLHCQITLKRSIEQKGKSNAVTNPESTSDSATIPVLDSGQEHGDDGAPLSSTERARLRNFELTSPSM